MAIEFGENQRLFVGGFGQRKAEGIARGRGRRERRACEILKGTAVQGSGEHALLNGLRQAFQPDQEFGLVGGGMS